MFVSACIAIASVHALKRLHMGQETTFSDYVHQIVSHTLGDSDRERGSGERGRVVLVGASMGGMLVLKAAQATHGDAQTLLRASDSLCAMLEGKLS